MECEKCNSKELETLKQEVHFARSLYYEDPDEYWVVTLKCKDCGHKFKECI